MAEYVSKVGAVTIGGVDRTGATHEPLVFKDARSVVTVADDDGQTYDQTLRLALEAGWIKDAPHTKAKES